MTTTTTRFLPSAILLVLLSTFHHKASATTNVISVNFQGRINSDVTNPPTDPLAPGDVAGVVPRANWNNVDDAYNNSGSITNFSANDGGTTAPLMDDNGSPTTVTLTFLANDSWFNDVPAANITSPNARMMNGIIKSQGPGASTVFTFNHLTDAQYDLYVYFNMNGDGVRTDITDGNLTKTFYVVEQHQFTDTSSFVACTNTNPAGPYDTGNYVRFTNLATYGESTLSVSAYYISGADGNGIAGLQLVEVGPAITNLPPPIILSQPLTRTAESGTHVDFTVVAKFVPTNVAGTYQWLSNGMIIPGATNQSFCIEGVQETNAASYQVIVTGTGGTNVSSLAYLSVYTLACGHSVVGSLITPVGLFTGTAFLCQGTSFAKSYGPTNGINGYFFFYGPNAGPQVGPFQNTGHFNSLTVDTFSGNNGTVDTGIMIQNNWAPITALCCNDDVGPLVVGELNSKQSQCVQKLSLVTGDPVAQPIGARNSYRVSVLYNGTAPPSGTITFNWKYEGTTGGE